MILAIIQARLASSRLPKKVLADINGKTMIQRVADQVRSIHGVNYGVVATPSKDNIPVEGLEVVSTNSKPDDVLGRFYDVAQRHPDADTIVRVSGDCPLLCPEIADEVIAMYQALPGCRYASNCDVGYIDGTDVEVFSREALVYAAVSTSNAEDREHVTLRMRQGGAKAKSRGVFDIKLSVDTKFDLECVRDVSKIIPGVGSSYYKLSTLHGAIIGYKSAQAVKSHTRR